MKKGMILVFSLLLGVTGLLFSADAAEKESKALQQVPDVVARVNGKPISGEAYSTLYKQREMDRMGTGMAGEPVSPEAMKRATLDQLIVVELLTQRADEIQLHVEPQDVEQRLKKIEERVGGKEKLEEALKARGLTLQRYRKDVEKSLRIQRLFDQEVLSKVKVEPGEVREFYEANPQYFQVPEEVRVRHIIVRFPSNATDQQKKEALKVIQEAAKRIRNGESFEEVAKEISQDGSAPRGGDLGYFPRGKMVPEFEKVAFSLEKGKVSEPIETRFGYHLVKVVDKRPAHLVPFEEAKSKIESYLKRKKGQDAVRAYVEDLKSKAKIETVEF
jgi:peptidyl-prolyl cis-trans isomerase C